MYLTKCFVCITQMFVLFVLTVVTVGDKCNPFAGRLNTQVVVMFIKLRSLLPLVCQYVIL